MYGLEMHAHLAYECVGAFVYKMLYHTFHKEEMYFVLCLVMMYREILYVKCSLHWSHLLYLSLMEQLM